MTSTLPIGPLMLDIEGLAVGNDEIHRLRHPGVGGVILFSRNHESAEQVRELVREIRSIRNGELLLAVDQEGGRVQRFQNGFTRLPPAASYAAGGEKSMRRTRAAGWLMAAELLAVGLDFSFAPLLDVDSGISQIIGDRSFGQRPEVATEHALAFRSGMRAAGMAAVGKHFPGHGGVAEDSHLTLPVDDREPEQLEGRDLIPFRRLIEEGLEGIMQAHVIYSRIDNQPAGFSDYWIRQVLRGDLGFEGAIFSDDLSMSGARYAGSYADRVRVALDAGCDMALICNQPEAAESVLDLAAGYIQPDRENRLKKMLCRPAFVLNELEKTQEWRVAVTQFENTGQAR
jgi:beta-N-acetylhexosaminidase